MNKWFVKRYISNIFESNTYLIYNDKYSIIIDPAVDYNIIKKDIKNELVGVLITHGHFDHFYEIKTYLDIPNTLFYCHKNAIKKLENSSLNCSKMCGARLEVTVDDRFKTINDGKLQLNDDIVIDVIYTPGHSDCSVCFLFDDLLFTGDFIFKGSIGRTDLYSGSSILMKESLKRFKDDKRLKKYQDYILYPGHEDYTTLDDEYHFNPYLK